jgi:hypothetical protein
MKFNEIISNMEICNALHVKGTLNQHLFKSKHPAYFEGSDVFGCAQTGTGKQQHLHYQFCSYSAIHHIRDAMQKSEQLFLHQPVNWLYRSIRVLPIMERIAIKKCCYLWCVATSADKRTESRERYFSSYLV